MPSPAVAIESVTHRYGERVALRDVSFTVAPGALFGVLGPNGSGKTTLFRILATLMPPSTGAARIFNIDTTHQADAVRQKLGLVFQTPALDEKLTVRENLRFHGALYGLSGAALRDRVDTLLQRFDVADRAHDAVETLSGGLERRVDLVRGLLHRPDVLLLDEPTTGLDPAARRIFWQTLDRLRRDEGTTLLLATHLMQEAERCDTVAILDEGALAATGSPEALKAELGDETLWLETDAPTALRDRIDAQFGVPTRIVGSVVQVAPADPPTFLSALYETLGDRIRSATLRTPTLEDVFMVHAGGWPDEDRERVLARGPDAGDRA